MMFAPVGSLAHYQGMEAAGVLGDYHLLLAHKVLEEPSAWRELYQSIRSQGREPFVIMDNSLIELGYSLGTNELLEASSVVGASCIVLADTLEDGKATIAQSFKMAVELDEASRHRDKEISALGVVQGATWRESIWCGKLLASIPSVLYLSVPRVATKQFKTRKDSIRALSGLNKPIHLLGFSDDTRDDFRCLSERGVMGIDSAVPVRMGLAGIAWGIGEDTPPRDPDFLESTDYDPMITENVLRVRHGVQ